MQFQSPSRALDCLLQTRLLPAVYRTLKYRMHHMLELHCTVLDLPKICEMYRHVHALFTVPAKHYSLVNQIGCTSWLADRGLEFSLHTGTCVQITLLAPWQHHLCSDDFTRAWIILPALGTWDPFWFSQWWNSRPLWIHLHFLWQGIVRQVRTERTLCVTSVQTGNQPQTVFYCRVSPIDKPVNKRYPVQTVRWEAVAGAG